jgi:putative membrane protein
VIKSFNDYAANERTFLAWVRTAIALMAFGFLLERFDLFLQMAALTMGNKAPRIADAGFGRGAGLGLLVAGVAITAVAAMRFVKNAKDIASDEVKSNKGRGVDIALAILLVLLGLALAVYLSHALIVGT